MTDQQKDISPLSAFGTIDEWRDIWMQAAVENHKAMTHLWENLGTPPSPSSAPSLFDPESVTHTLTKAMGKLAEKPETLKKVSKRYLANTQTLLQSMCDQLRLSDYQHLQLPNFQ